MSMFVTCRGGGFGFPLNDVSTPCYLSQVPTTDTQASCSDALRNNGSRLEKETHVKQKSGILGISVEHGGS